jgi:ABC-type oligopeptide transport system substrate-binding subunit
LSQAIAEDLRKAGLVVEIVEHAQLGPLMQKGDFEGLLLAGRDTAEPTRFLNVPFEGGHYAVEKPAGPHYDEAMVEAYERYSASLYEERRMILDSQLQRLWLERLPLIPLLHTSRMSAVRAELVGPELGQADQLWWNLAEWRKQ